MVTPAYEEPFNNGEISNHGSLNHGSLNTTTIRYAAPEQIMEPSGQFAEQVERQRDMMNLEDPKNDLIPPPQPRQMARLIPKTSRNLVHDSNIIPHIYNADSKDRDDMNYPTSSEYRLRIPEYKDVLSIELKSAEITISVYSMAP